MLQCYIYKVLKALRQDQSLQGEDVTFCVGSWKVEVSEIRAGVTARGRPWDWISEAPNLKSWVRTESGAYCSAGKETWHPLSEATLLQIPTPENSTSLRGRGSASASGSCRKQPRLTLDHVIGKGQTALLIGWNGKGPSWNVERWLVDRINM